MSILASKIRWVAINIWRGLGFVLNETRLYVFDISISKSALRIFRLILDLFNLYVTVLFLIAIFRYERTKEAIGWNDEIGVPFWLVLAIAYALYTSLIGVLILAYKNSDNIQAIKDGLDWQRHTNDLLNINEQIGLFFPLHEGDERELINEYGRNIVKPIMGEAIIHFPKEEKIIFSIDFFVTELSTQLLYSNKILGETTNCEGFLSGEIYTTKSLIDFITDEVRSYNSVGKNFVQPFILKGRLHPIFPYKEKDMAVYQIKSISTISDYEQLVSAAQEYKISNGAPPLDYINNLTNKIILAKEKS